MGIPVNEPLLNGNEKLYINECIDSGWISSEGPFVKRFESDFSTYVDRKYGVSVSNGTAALQLAFEALDLDKGSEVILPSFTIISCVLPLIRLGLKPVFVDCDSHTWNMEAQSVQMKITSKTKAILVVHLYGLPVDMDEITMIAKENKLFVIEDAAEVIGLKYKGRMCGSFGDISTFSFYPNKHITTGEGGMIVTNNKSFSDKCKLLRNLCFIPEQRFLHNELGYNFRMTNMQAALGVAQLEQIDKVVARKRWIGDKYLSLLSNLNEYFQLPLQKTEYADNIYWIFGIVLKTKSKNSAVDYMKFLAEFKIGTRPFFYPLHKQPVLKPFINQNESFEVSDKLGDKGFYIPSGLAITEDQIMYVVKILNKAVNQLEK